MRSLLCPAAVLLALAGCSSAAERDAAPAPTPGEPTSAVSTITLPPPPSEPPPTGEVRADLRQSSRDLAAGQVQVWITNDTARTLVPRRLVFADPRWAAPVSGRRLRPIPSQSYRGYPLPYPAPACGVGERRSRLVVVTASGRRVVPVADDNDLVERYQRDRCFALAVSRVARLGWADPPVRVDGDRAWLRLAARPRPAGSGVLSVEEVHGTPVFTPVRGTVWSPGLAVRPGGAARVVELPVRPVRCDAHVFQEAGGGTAFRTRLRVGTRTGELVLRMTPRQSQRTIGYAVRACGLR